MQLVITSRRFELEPDDRTYAERRLAFALGRFADRVIRATLTFQDVNGPRGGVDKLARLILQVRRAESIAVTSEAATIREAADLVAERAKRAVARHCRRIRTRRSRADGFKDLPSIGA